MESDQMSTSRRMATFMSSLALAATLAVGTAPVSAQDTDLNVLGAELVDEFIAILKQPDEAKKAGLEGFLADEFQIVRDSGARLDQAGYVANPATVLEVEISDLVATENDGVLVASYTLAVDEVIDGESVKTVRPRLSVFHRGDDGRWRIAAHANFGAVPDEG
jgi:ketosteroid isomerase-like protein